MANLKLQARLAASILGCGRRRVWLDPNESQDIAGANSRANVRRLIKNYFIIRKPEEIRSRARWAKRKAAKRLGRHMGLGLRNGTKEARTPSKGIWMRRVRVLRRLLTKYREARKIDKHLYRKLYISIKGGVFKNKRTLMEHIHRAKSEIIREKQLSDQLEAKKVKSMQKREKMRKRENKRRDKEREKAHVAKMEVLAKGAKHTDKLTKDTLPKKAKEQPKAKKTKTK
ncbi:60S ribosomal protein [Perkinsela sp. CCAP 1560/4]|nr:60S ribosomal protein [Perkinsela sp. CCAP 1560/4]|eukprot:KNH05408.1 60S ribosomal protein [Perkinsela sp. CCAP 1560/4]